MAEYIERDALINILKAKEDAAPLPHKSAYRSALTTVHMLPAADVAPVRHGAWEGTADGYADGELVYDMWNCSECGFDADGAEEKPDWKFCPNCGSLMDGGADNGE